MKPNILWIVTTQWRAQACGFAGDANASTPFLDAFAATAANFRQAVTPHPFGPFARAALLTGVPSPANGVRGYYDPLPRNARTVAHELADLGYETAFFGKWHLAERDREAPLVGEAHARQVVPPSMRGGFAVWEGFEGGFLLNDPWLHGTALPQPTQFQGYQANVLCARAAEWVSARSMSAPPWFAVVSLEPPHPPYQAPAAGFLPRDPAALVLPPNVPAGAAATRARRELAGYYAHIEATDRAVGRLLDALCFDDTVVVVTSVHGDMHGSHGCFRKGWPYEESVRVPMLVRLPSETGGTGWAGVRDDMVSLIDLPRWTREWARGNRVPANAAPTQQISMPSVVALADQCDRAWRGVRTGMRKLIVADGTDAHGHPQTKPWLYFDLERDPYERTNLVDDSSRRTELESLQLLIKLPPPDEITS